VGQVEPRRLPAIYVVQGAGGHRVEHDIRAVCGDCFADRGAIGDVEARGGNRDYVRAGCAQLVSDVVAALARRAGDQPPQARAFHCPASA
jgi:hypothetical protein